MKRTYEKPEIFFESFTLSLNIASNCEVGPKNPRLEMTGVGENGGVGYAFSSSCDADVTDAGGDGGYNGVCYHTFDNNGLMNVFYS